jgi:hypothetical protein
MKRLIVLLAVAAALLAPSAALASGVVLKVQPSAHLVAVASSRTHVVLLHTSAAARLHVGQRVAITSHALGNGTFAASRVRVIGHSHAFRFRGLLLAKSSEHLVVSAGGAVITVHRGSPVTMSTPGTSPQPGSTIDVQVTVGRDDELDEDDVTLVAPTTPGGTIEGHLTLGAGTITVTSEHLNLVLKVPTGTDLSAFRTGDEVLATFTQGADGSLTLTRLSTADDDEDTNDGHGDRHGGGDDHGGHGGHHGGGD